MIDFLKEKCKTNDFISVYSRSDNSENFSFGIILMVSDQHYAMQMFSPEGKTDGVKLAVIDDILRIEENDGYIERMKTLMNMCPKEEKRYNLDENNPIFSLLHEAQTNKYVVSIELSYSGINDVRGFVNELQEDVCIVTQIDLYGRIDGSTIFRINDITQVICDSSDEKVLKCLFENT